MKRIQVRFSRGLSLALTALAAGIASLVDDALKPVPRRLAQLGGVAVADPTSDDIKAELGKISDQVKAAGEKALAEAQKGITMSATMKERVDEMLIKQGELQARLLEAEQKLEKRSAAADTGPKSSSQQLIENKAFQAWAAAKNTKQGFTQPMAAITSLGTSAGVGVEQDRLAGILPLPQRRLTVRDLIAPGRTSSSSILYVKETGYTNNAGMVSEGTAKPESDITFDDEVATVKKIAHFVKATTEILDDFPQLQSVIDQRLIYGLKLKEETQLLKGSGVGNNINGIYTQATAYSAPIDPPGTETVIDVIRLMLLQAALAEYDADGIVLHPSDWAVIELLKDTTGRYIIGNPQGVLRPTLWGRPVVATLSMTVDTALVGAFMQGAQVFDRMQAAVTIATENEDDFIKNKVTILAEERLALAVYRPEAFIKNTNLP